LRTDYKNGDLISLTADLTLQKSNPFIQKEMSNWPGLKMFRCGHPLLPEVPVEFKLEGHCDVLGLCNNINLADYSNIFSTICVKYNI